MYLPEIANQSHCLLLVDNYRAHLTEESQQIAQECHSELIFIPPGCTPLVQPMDVSINCLFKAKVEPLWVSWFQSHSDLAPKGNLKQPTRQDAINWVSTVWADISVSTIKESFVSCGITAAISGVDDDRMLSHVPRVVFESSGSVDDDDDDGCVSDESDDIDFEGFDFDFFPALLYLSPSLPQLFVFNYFCRCYFLLLTTPLPHSIFPVFMSPFCLFCFAATTLLCYSIFYLVFLTSPQISQKISILGHDTCTHTHVHTHTHTYTHKHTHTHTYTRT